MAKAKKVTRKVSTTKRNSSLKSTPKWLDWKVLTPTLLIFALIGGYYVYSSFAATVPPVFISANVSGITSVNTDGSAKKSFPNPKDYYYGHRLKLSRDKLQLASNERNGLVIYNPTTGAVKKRIACSNGKACGEVVGWLPGDRSLVYDTDTQIRRINIDGTGDKILANKATSGGSLKCASVQRTGSKIAYTEALYRQNYLGNRIIVMDADGSNKKIVKQVPGQEKLGCPNWSNDGAKIAYMHSVHEYKHYATALNIVGVNGGSSTFVADLFRSSNANDWDSDDHSWSQSAAENIYSGRIWSNGNSTLLFPKSVKGVVNLYQINLANKKVTPVTSNKDKNTDLQHYGFALDNRIVYAAELNSSKGKGNVDTKNYSFSLRSVRADGKAHRLLMQSAKKDYFNGLEL